MKSILTLLIAVAIGTTLNAQTPTETRSQPKPVTPGQTPVQAEPQKKIAYEIVPAKRVITPTNQPVPASTHPTNISDIKQQEEQDKKVQESIENRKTYTETGTVPQKQTEGTTQPK